jgi:hypothetical protein
MALLDAPIPGQSLTAAPRNPPYERPPEISDPDEALMVHLSKLNDAETMEGVTYLIQKGVDVRTITEGILRSAVMEGIHSIDVSLIVAPIVHEFIATTLDAVGLEYDHGFDDKESESELRYAQNANLAKKVLSGEKELGDPVDEPKKQEEQIEMDLEEPKPEPKGLMARA